MPPDRATIGFVTTPALPHQHALAALVGDLYAFTDGWLGNRRLSEHTRDAYRRDVTSWLRWCEEQQLDPLAATFIHVNTYARVCSDRRRLPSHPSVNAYRSPPMAGKPAAAESSTAVTCRSSHKHARVTLQW